MQKTSSPGFVDHRFNNLQRAVLKTVSHAIACEWLAATIFFVFYRPIIGPWAELFAEKIKIPRFARCLALRAHNGDMLIHPLWRNFALRKMISFFYLRYDIIIFSRTLLLQKDNALENIFQFWSNLHTNVFPAKRVQLYIYPPVVTNICVARSSDHILAVVVVVDAWEGFPCKKRKGAWKRILKFCGRAWFNYFQKGRKWKKR